MSLAFYSFCQKSEFSMNENPVVHLSMIEYVSINLLPENCVQVRLLSRFIAVSAS